MRCLGFLSAGEPDTTGLYWRQFHEEIRRLTGRRHSGRIIAESLDAAELRAEAVGVHDPRRAGRRLAEAARRIERRGAKGVLLCSSALHPHAETVRNAVGIPVLHIASAMAEKLRRVGLHPPALLGLDRARGEERAWQRVLAACGIKETILPTMIDSGFVQEQLRRGLNSETAADEIRAAFIRLSVDLKHTGARVIVLARPELAFALPEEKSVLPTICALQAHCELAARFVLDCANGGAYAPAGTGVLRSDDPRDARK